jgi:hypothetical protein
LVIGSYRVYIYRLDIKKWHTFWNFLNFPYFSYVMTYERGTYTGTAVVQLYYCESQSKNKGNYTNDRKTFAIISHCAV